MVIGSGELYQKVAAITAAVGDRNRGREGLAALAQTLRAVDAKIAWSERVVLGTGFEAGVRDVLKTVIQHVRNEPPAGAVPATN